MTRSVAIQLPAPEACTVRSGATYWAGGVRVLGTMICIPGRVIHLDDIAEARAHAASVLAACDVLEGR